MTAVGTDVAVVEAMELRAVTRTRSVEPTSACLRLYVRPVAPAMLLQLPPVALHCRHWAEYEIGCVPDQVPGSPVSV